MSDAAVTRARRRLGEAFVDLHPADAAAALERTPVEEIARFLESQPARRAAALLDRLTPDSAVECLGRLSPEGFRRIVSAADVMRAAHLLARLEPEDRPQRLSLLDSRLARELEQLMAYPPESAGHLMDPRVVSFPATMTVWEVLRRLQTLRRRRVQTIFLTDEAGRLTGAVPLQEVIMASSRQRLEELVTGPPVAVQATAPRDEVIEALTDYRLGSLPVVDYDGRLVGTIRREAMIQAVQEAATAGILTMVGVSREERALSRPLFAVRKRLPWLNVNLMTAFLAAAVVGVFEETIARFTALAVLLPVVAGQSGNTGAQALAVTMRGLALREVRLWHWPRIALKEATVGTLNGLAVAAVTMLGVFVWSGSWGLCAVIGLAMVSSMIVAGVSGTVIPVLLTALRQDPAQSSSIILTTVTDVIGFFSFLGLATALSHLLEA